MLGLGNYKKREKNVSDLDKGWDLRTGRLSLCPQGNEHPSLEVCPDHLVLGQNDVGNLYEGIVSDPIYWPTCSPGPRPLTPSRAQLPPPPAHLLHHQLFQPSLGCMPGPGGVFFALAAANATAVPEIALLTGSLNPSFPPLTAGEAQDLAPPWAALKR